MQDDEQHEVMSLLSPQASLVIGVALLFGAWYFGGSVAELAFNGARAQGTIARVAEIKGEDEDAPQGYLPVISFTDKTGERRSFSPRKASQRADKYATGESVPVLYLPNDPAGTAVMDKGAEMWWTPGMFALFGALFLFSGIRRLQQGGRAV